MIKVTYHRTGEIEDSLLRFAVIAARYRDKWVFCRHKERTTWEIPGGHREPGESINHKAEEFLLSCGMTEEELGNLRKNLLEA